MVYRMIDEKALQAAKEAYLRCYKLNKQDVVIEEVISAYEAAKIAALIAEMLAEKVDWEATQMDADAAYNQAVDDCIAIVRQPTFIQKSGCDCPDGHNFNCEEGPL